MEDIKTLISKNILLGVSGHVSAYRCADLVRRFQDAGANVRIVMTKKAKEFITPLTLQAVSSVPVHDDLFDAKAEAAMGHIELARWADVVCVVPASASFIDRAARGEANDLLTTLCLATTSPVVVLPAMDETNHDDKAMAANLQELKNHGVHVFSFQEKSFLHLATELEPQKFILKIAELFKGKKLSGKHVVVTAGPTHEAIDPVRFLSNRSSGKNGFCYGCCRA